MESARQPQKQRAINHNHCFYNLTSTRLPARNISESEWDTFVSASPQRAFCLLYGYMSLVAPDWEAVIVEENGVWLAVMPLCGRQKWGFKTQIQPLFSPYWGIVLADVPLKNRYEAFSFYKQILSEILTQIPAYHLLKYRFAPHFPYFLPFHWAGFTLRTRFTYQLDLGEGAQALRFHCADSLKRQLKKAEKHSYSIDYEQDNEKYLSFIEGQKNKGKNLLGLPDKQSTQAMEMLRGIMIWLKKRELGKLIAVKNEAGEILACGLYVYDKQKVWYLGAANNPEIADAAAVPFMMWSVIADAALRGFTTFDFEGSMLEGIERFFRNFGAVPVPYTEIYHNRLPPLLSWIFKS